MIASLHATLMNYACAASTLILINDCNSPEPFILQFAWHHNQYWWSFVALSYCIITVYLNVIADTQRTPRWNLILVRITKTISEKPNWGRECCRNARRSLGRGGCCRYEATIKSADLWRLVSQTEPLAFICAGPRRDPPRASRSGDAHADHELIRDTGRHVWCKCSKWEPL